MPTKGAFRRQESQRRPSPSYAEKELHRPNGCFSSRKCRRQISFWTPLEFKALSHFEVDPQILSITERPQRLALRDGPNWLTYIPSFEVELESGPVIVELSSFGRPMGPKQEHAAELIRAYYRKQGIGFAELGQLDFRSRPRSINVGILMRYLSVHPDEKDVLRVHDVVDRQSVRLDDVRRSSGVGLPTLVAMLRQGDIVRRQRGILDRNTAVSAYEGAQQ